MTTHTEASTAVAGGTPRATAMPPPWRLPLLTIAAALLAAFMWPDQLGLISRVASTALLVLSLDLLVGYAGIATLGQSALFGAGAYGAGLFAQHVSGDPLIGLVVAAVAGAALAAASGAFLLRFEGFTLLMLTIALAQILLSLASTFRGITGGDDGLSDFTIRPILGLWEFDLEGRVGAIYAVAVLAVGLYLARRVANSPFGLSIRGIHESRARMAALGTPVRKRLIAIYAMSGALAGVSGAVTAQINGIVGLDSLGFALSAESLVMLVLGGAGNLSGAVVGASVFTLLHHTAASIDPYHWLFVIGVALMAVVLFPPAALAQQIWARLRAQRKASS